MVALPRVPFAELDGTLDDIVSAEGAREDGDEPPEARVRVVLVQILADSDVVRFPKDEAKDEGDDEADLGEEGEGGFRGLEEERCGNGGTDGGSPESD